MRPRPSLLLAVLLVLPLVGLTAVPAAVAGPAEEYTGPYFGDGNLPPGCIDDMSRDNPENVCHHMRTDLNALDSPQVDVLVLVPASPFAERDMRIMRQSIEMWEGGIDHLARQMGLDWLAEGVDFHITLDVVDPTGEDGGEFTTYPVVDPEIVVIATNPVGGVGIGIDPVDFGAQIDDITTGGLLIQDEDAVPCHNIPNPFDFEYWENLPGFDSHHESRSGTHTEDCGGAGGNVCFAVNGAIDADPQRMDFFGLFDLVSHEVGHCLTLGHVGDGAEGDWGVVATNDIMAYDAAPHGLTKCVSTLDVEVFATRMSQYLDVADLTVNDVAGDGRNPFQVQHPRDHLYASSTGSPLDCPQPDLGLVPGERTDWTPETVPTTRPALTVTDATAVDGDTIRVAGMVEHASLDAGPDGPSGRVDDADDDAMTPVTEILALDVAVTDTHVTGTLDLAQVASTAPDGSAVSYSLVVDGNQFDSFVPAGATAPVTWDAGSSTYVEGATSTWDQEAGTVTISIPRAHLAEAGITAPYDVLSQSNLTYGEAQTLQRLLSVATLIDDRAPHPSEPLAVAAPGAATMRVPQGLASRLSQTQTHEGTFYTEESTFGVTPELGLDWAHTYAVEVPQRSDVSATLAWTDATGQSDLDLYVSGAATGSSASLDNPEAVDLTGVTGTLEVRVDPYFVADPVGGAQYTLEVVVTPLDVGDGGDTGDPDRDRDGVADDADACPDHSGVPTNGCPQTGTVRLVAEDGTPLAAQPVSTLDGPDAFELVADGLDADSHTLDVQWVEDGQVTETATVTVTRDEAGQEPDEGGTCPADADTTDTDGDGTADACDPDVDGDGHSNGKERAHGTDPTDPDDHPARGRHG